MSGAKAVRTVAMAEATAHGACALCTVLRHYQAQLIEITGLEKVTHLCNQHAWLLARSAPADMVARIYTQVIESQNRHAVGSSRVCGFCAELHREENLRLREVAQRMTVTSFMGWMRRSGTLCLWHAEQLSRLLPDMRPVFDEVLARTREELQQDLKKCLANPARGQHHVGGGVLGRVAEYLVCQRGIPGEERPC